MAADDVIEAGPRAGLGRWVVVAGVVLALALAALRYDRPRPVAAPPAPSAPSAQPAAEATTTVVPPDVRARLDAIGREASVLVSPTKVRVFEPPLFGMDRWGSVDEDGAVRVPGPLVADPAYPREPELIAFLGVGNKAFRHYVMGHTGAVEREFAALSERAARALWVPAYNHLQVTDTLFDPSFDTLYSSSLAVLRYYAGRFGVRFRALSAPEQHAVRLFMTTVIASFGPKAEYLRTLLPGLAVTDGR
jgi:hypothetical protein